MPEKVEEPCQQEVGEAKEQVKDSDKVVASVAESKDEAASDSQVNTSENGGGEKPDEKSESKPKARGRKSKENGEGPASKKTKEIKSPARISTRVRNRSTGEKLPEFKDMEDELPSPTRRRSKLGETEEEKSVANDGQQATEAIA